MSTPPLWLVVALRTLIAVAWLYMTFRTSPAWYIILLIENILLYLLTFYALSLIATEQWRASQAALSKKAVTENDGKPGPRFAAPPGLILLVRLLGAISGACTLAIAIIFPPTNGFQACNVRNVVIWFVAKSWQLCLAHGHQPPILLQKDSQGQLQPAPLATFSDRLRYLWTLIIEFRYASFDIAVYEPHRSATPPPYASIQTAWSLLAYPLAILIPIPEIQIFATLYSIYTCILVYHTILHTFCPHPPFYYPFAAPSMTAFWRVHWHQEARPWLHTFAYRPAHDLGVRLFGRSAGRALGVLATFHLSGLWHGWLIMSFSHFPLRAGWGLWAVFMGQGVWIVLERALWGERLGKVWWQSLLSWVVLIESGALWLRYADVWFGFASIWEFGRMVVGDFL